MGWFRSAGSWMGDKVDAATETVGRWADQTKQVAQDAWDVATSTSVGMEDGSLYLETDLDELSDLMSPETRAALALDRATADNRVRITYTRSTGELVATSDEIALAGIDTEKVRAGQVVLRGVRAVFTNTDGGIPGLGENFSLLGYKDAADNLQAVVTISTAVAVDVAFDGPDGPSTVASVALEGLSGTIGAQGGLPFAEAGTTEVDFALEHAVLEGLSAGGHTVDSAELKGISAGMSGSEESAFLAADSVAVAGVGGASGSAGEARLDGLRVDVDNAGGGLLGVDGTADRAKARVAVEAARVSDVDTADFDADHVSATDFSGSYDTTTGTGGARVHQLRSEGLDTSWVDANRLQADRLSLDADLLGQDGRRDAHLRMGGLRGDGLAITPVTDGRDAADTGGMPLDWSADVGSLDVTNAHAGGADIAHTTASGARLSGALDGDASQMQGEVRDLSLSGFSHAAMSADSLSTTNTTLSADASTMSATADHVRAAGLQTESLRAAELNGYGGSASFGRGSATAALDSAHMTDATVMDRVDIADAQVAGLSATKAGDHAGITLGSASVTGLSDRQTGAQLDQGTLRGADVRYNTQSSVLDASLASAELAGARGLGGSLDTGAVTGLTASHGPDRSQLAVDSAQVSGLAHGTSRLDSASVAGVTASRQGGQSEAAVTSASLSGARHGDTQLGGATIAGITATQSGDRQTLAAQSAELSSLAHGTTTVAGVSGTGLSATRDAAGLRGGADRLDARDLQVGDTASVARAHASGLAVSQSDAGLSATVTEAGLQDARYSGDGMQARLASASVSAGSLQHSAQGLTTGAEAVRLQGLSASGTSGGGGASGLDTARLVETGAAQVRDAELSAQARLRGGDLGVAGLEARRGTQVDAGVSIRGGRVQDQGTGVGLSAPIDGPLWTSVRGAYMDNGQLKADVKGWRDKDVTGTLNDAIGVRGDRMPSVATLGAGAANVMRQPASGSSSGPGLSDIVDMDSVRLDANAQLGDGVIDAGLGSVDLGRAQRAGDNRVDVSASNGSLEAEIQRFLADSARYSSGGTQASSGRTQASGVELDATERGWSLQADDLQAQDVRASKS